MFAIEKEEERNRLLQQVHISKINQLSTIIMPRMLGSSNSSNKSSSKSPVKKMIFTPDD